MKAVLAASFVMVLGIEVADAAAMTSATFTMLDPIGATIHADTTVTGSITNNTWSVSSTVPFFGKLWTAHNGVVFDPGTYSIDTIEGGSYNFTVDAGQIGGHILLDSGATANIDVINVWDISTVDGVMTFTSADIDGNGIRGIGMIDGPYINFSMNFDFSTAVPVPPALWLFGSGLAGLGLMGGASRKAPY